MVHDWEYEKASAEGDAFEAWAIEQGWDLDDPEALVWWEARKVADAEAYAASLEP